MELTNLFCTMYVSVKKGNYSISKAVVKANGGETIAGDISIGIDDGSVNASAQTITVTPPSPIDCTGEARLIPVMIAPVTLSQGYTVTLTDTDGNSFSVGKTEPVTLEAGGKHDTDDARSSFVTELVFCGDNMVYMIDAGLVEEALKIIPAKRVGRPEEVAHAVSMFMDRRAGFMTGQMLYVCGGVSVGQKDYLPLVLEKLGAQLLVEGVAQKPGSPMLAAALGGKLVFCLSGNPFAAAATLEQYAIPALLRAAGRREESCIPARTVCTLTNGFSKPSKGNRYLRATACGGKVTLPGAGNTEAHSSGALSAMMGCNCLVEIPAGSGPVEPGTEVEVLCFVQ